MKSGESGSSVQESSEGKSDVPSDRLESHRTLSNIVAPYYDFYELLNPGTRFVMKKEEEIVERMTSLLADRDAALDMGCGTGRHTLPLARAFKRVVALDTSNEMIREAQRLTKKQHLDNVEFITADAESSEFVDASFDLMVCSFGLFSFLFNDVRSINKFARMLKPSGLLFSTVYSKQYRNMITPLINRLPWHSPLAISWASRHSDLLAVRFRETNYDIHAKPYFSTEFVKLLHSAGLEVVTVSAAPATLWALPKKILENPKLCSSCFKLEGHLSRTGFPFFQHNGPYIMVGARRVAGKCPPHNYDVIESIPHGMITTEILICSDCGDKITVRINV